VARRFADRADAGRQLGARLAERPRPGAVVLGLPRGGVVVAAGVAAALGAPLDLLAVRKIGCPGRAELAMGAVAAVAGVVETVRVEEVLAASPVREEVFGRVREVEVAELRRREAAYRGDRPPLELRGRPVVLVDDGMATGATMRAAVAAARGRAPAALTVAVPVGASRPLARLRAEVEEVVALLEPADFRSVDQAYDDFSPTADAEVRAAMRGGPPPA
jgi:putative phosphoribosyl transferase